MVCDGCDELMQRETVVFVTRGRGRMRSTALPGWYCWTCKTSAHAAGDLIGPPRSVSPRPHAAALLAAVAGRCRAAFAH